MLITARVFPLIWTATSISSSFMASSSHSGHCAWNTLSSPPNCCHSSSPIWGAKGARRITKVLSVSLSIPPSFLASSISLLLYSMKPEITVLRLNWLKRYSMSYTSLWRSFIISLDAFTSLSLLSITRFQKRFRKRDTPSMPRSSHSASSSGGPTNSS